MHCVKPQQRCGTKCSKKQGNAMIDLSRRQLLTGAAAATAATALSPFERQGAQAAVAPAGSQAPGFYRYKVGTYECTSINDGARSFPLPDTFVTNVPKAEAAAAASMMLRIVTNLLRIHSQSTGGGYRPLHELETTSRSG